MNREQRVLLAPKARNLRPRSGQLQDQYWYAILGPNCSHNARSDGRSFRIQCGYAGPNGPMDSPPTRGLVSSVYLQAPQNGGNLSAGSCETVPPTHAAMKTVWGASSYETQESRPARNDSNNEWPPQLA